MKNLFIGFILLFLFSTCSDPIHEGFCPPYPCHFYLVDKDSMPILNKDNFGKLTVHANYNNVNKWANNPNEYFNFHINDVKPFKSWNNDFCFQSNEMVGIYATPPFKLFYLKLDGKPLGILQIFTQSCGEYPWVNRIIFNDRVVPNIPESVFNNSNNGDFSISTSINPQQKFVLVVE